MGWSQLRQTLKTHNVRQLVIRLESWGRESCCQLLLGNATTFKSLLEDLNWEHPSPIIEPFSTVWRSLQALCQGDRNEESQ